MDLLPEDLLRHGFERLRVAGLARLRNAGRRYRNLSHLGLLQIAERAAEAICQTQDLSNKSAVESWARSLAKWMHRASVDLSETCRAIELLADGLREKMDGVPASIECRWEAYALLDGGVNAMLRTLGRAAHQEVERKEKVFQDLTVQLVGLSSFGRAAKLALQAARLLTESRSAAIVFFAMHDAECVVESLSTGDQESDRLREVLERRTKRPSQATAVQEVAVAADELFVPMMHRGRVIGELVLVGRRRSGKRFTANDSKWACKLADHAAAALASARLRARDKRRLEELTVLNQFSQRAGFAASVEEVIRILMESLQAATTFEYAAAVVVQKERGQIHISGKETICPRDYELIIQRAMTACERFSGGALEPNQRTVVQAPEVVDGPSFAGDWNYFETAFVLPTHGHFAGVLIAAGSSTQSFGPSRQRFAASLATHASHALQRLRSVRSAERYRLETIVEQLRDGVILLDGNKRLNLANETGRQVLASGAGQFRGQLLERFGPYHLDDLITASADEGRTGETLLNRSPTGEQRHYEIVPHVVGPREKPRAILIILREVTARVRAQRDIAYAKDFAEVLVDTAPAVVLALDARGRVVRANAQAVETIGQSAEQLVGKDWIDAWIDVGDQESLRLGLAEVTAGGKLRGKRAVLQTADGRRRDFAWWGRRLPSKAKEGVAVVIGLDLTPLVEAQERALQSERLAAIGEMTTGLSHESRNALQRSQAALELLRFRINDDADLVSLCDSLQSAQDYLVGLYDEVRDYAAPLRLHTQVICLREVLQQAWDNLAIVRERRNATLVHTGDPDARAAVDPIKMWQVFRNILENSLAAAVKPTVSVIVEWRLVVIDDQPWLRISLCDDGPGFTIESRDRIFQPFFTSKPKGTGLGMPIVKRIIDAHGGEIVLGPANVQGAEVVVLIPKGRVS